MTTKICIKCGVVKDENLFVKDRNTCKECKAKYLKEYGENHKEERTEYLEKTRERKLKVQAEYVKNNKEKVKKQQKNIEIHIRKKLLDEIENI